MNADGKVHTPYPFSVARPGHLASDQVRYPHVEGKGGEREALSYTTLGPSASVRFLVQVLELVDRLPADGMFERYKVSKTKLQSCPPENRTNSVPSPRVVSHRSSTG